MLVSKLVKYGYNFAFSIRGCKLSLSDDKVIYQISIPIVDPKQYDFCTVDFEYKTSLKRIHGFFNY